MEIPPYWIKNLYLNSTRNFQRLQVFFLASHRIYFLLLSATIFSAMFFGTST